MRLVMVFRVSRHLSSISDQLFQRVPLAKEFNQLRILSANLVNKAFFFLKELLKSVSTLLFEDLGNFSLCNAICVPLCKNVIQHLSMSVCFFLNY